MTALPKTGVSSNVTFRSRKEHSTTANAFEREFAREILKSDRLRVTILMGVIISALLIVLGVASFGFNQFQRTFHGNIKGFVTTLLMITSVTVICLVGERLTIDYLIRKQAHPSTALQYLSAFVETSIPTLAMTVGSVFLGPVYALFTPAMLL